MKKIISTIWKAEKAPVVGFVGIIAMMLAVYFDGDEFISQGWETVSWGLIVLVFTSIILYMYDVYQKNK